MTNGAMEKGCEQFDNLDALKAAISRYFDRKVWGPHNDVSSPWFEHSNTKLRAAFGVFCSKQLPELPTRATPLQGTDAVAVYTELQQIASEVLKWAQKAQEYLECIRGALSGTCKQRTENLNFYLRECTQLLAAAFPGTPSGASHLTVCVHYYDWARSFREWGRVFGLFEQEMVDCIKQESYAPGVPVSDEQTPAETPERSSSTTTASSDIPVENKQISQVPWPPWEV